MNLTWRKDAAKNNISVRLLRYFGSSIIVTFIAGIGKPRHLRSKFARSAFVHGHSLNLWFSVLYVDLYDVYMVHVSALLSNWNKKNDY